jgi:L-ascorbate metabolism protein UlaG (beta-lactamase superfamily)
VWDRITGKRRSSPDRAPVPAVPADLALLATPPARGEPARVTWLGHASFLVQVDGVSLLVDPALRGSIFGGIDRNVPPGVPIEKLPPIDASLVSHSHYDHLDLPTLKKVGAPVVAGLGLERFFRDRGLFVTELGWWKATEVKGVRVTFVPAHHWSRRGAFDTNETLWGGFVIEGEGATVYHSGDTAYFAGFAEIAARFPDIDAALLPVGAYEPGWFMLKQHMDPEQALQAFEDLGARTFVAMHWGTFKLSDEPLDEPPRRVEAERLRRGLPAERVRVPAVGETLALGRARAGAGVDRAVPVSP